MIGFANGLLKVGYALTIRESGGVVVNDVADAEATNEFLVEFIASCCCRRV